jgi:hypothetical protein
MAKTLAVNENNDIYIGSDGNLAFATGVTAVLQACQQTVQTLLGEMPLAVDQGLPNFQTLWDGNPNLLQYEAALRSAILAVTNVVDILNLQVDLINNVLSYTAVILTTYGQGNLNG